MNVVRRKESKDTMVIEMKQESIQQDCSKSGAWYVLKTNVVPGEVKVEMNKKRY